MERHCPESAEKKSPDFSPYPEELPACIYGTIRGQEFISHGILRLYR